MAARARAKSPERLISRRNSKRISSFATLGAVVERDLDLSPISALTPSFRFANVMDQFPSSHFTRRAARRKKALPPRTQTTAIIRL